MLFLIHTSAETSKISYLLGLPISGKAALVFVTLAVHSAGTMTLEVQEFL